MAFSILKNKKIPEYNPDGMTIDSAIGWSDIQDASGGIPVPIGYNSEKDEWISSYYVAVNLISGTAYTFSSAYNPWLQLYYNGTRVAANQSYYDEETGDEYYKPLEYTPSRSGMYVLMCGDDMWGMGESYTLSSTPAVTGSTRVPEHWVTATRRDELNIPIKYSTISETLRKNSGALFDIDIIDSKPTDVSPDNYSVVTSLEGSARKIDGRDSWFFNRGYIYIPPKAKEFVFGSTDFTIDVMLYPITTERQCVFAYQNDGVFAIAYSYSGDKKLSWFLPFNWNPNVFSQEIPLNAWSKIRIARVGTKLQCYVNGVLSGESDIGETEIGSPNQYISFGRWGGDPGDFRSRWVGYMDDMSIKV